MVALVWFVVALFFIPYKDNREIVYDVLWAGRSEKVDLLRVLLQFGMLFIVTYILFRYFRRFNALEKQQYKKLAKREIYLFFVFLLSILVCGFYLFGTNYINKKRDQKLVEQIAPIEQQIEQNSRKRRLGQEFWDENRLAYDVSEFDGKINRLWDVLTIQMRDEPWLTKYYNSFRKKDYWEEYNSLQRRLGIKTPNQLREFIKNNALTEEDFKKDEENRILSEKLNNLQQEKSKLKFYNNKDIRRINLITLAITFALLYLVRPLFWFVKGLFTEIKE